MATTWTEWAERARSARSSGQLIAHRQRRGSKAPARAAADACLRERGYVPLGDRWIEIDGTTAEQTLVHVLSTNLSSEEPAMDRREAQRLAAELLACCSPAVFLTNGVWVAGAIFLGPGSRVGPVWSPVASSCFDGGVVAVSRHAVTMLWVTDDP